MDVLVFGVDEDFGMSHRILLGLVDPRVQGRHVDVLDLLSRGLVSGVMEFDSVGASAEEGVSGIKRFDEFQVWRNRARSELVLTSRPQSHSHLILTS